MTADDGQITMYGDASTKAELEARAEEANQSVSRYCLQVLRDHLDEEQSREIDAETRVEQAMEEIVSIGKDELRQTARDIASMNARMGVYSIANWELLKQQHPDAARRDALSAGSRRLRKSLDDDLAAALSGDIDATRRAALADLDAADASAEGGDEYVF